jgi:hypothetical protein
VRASSLRARAAKAELLPPEHFGSRVVWVERDHRGADVTGGDSGDSDRMEEDLRRVEVGSLGPRQPKDQDRACTWVAGPECAALALAQLQFAHRQRVEGCNLAVGEGDIGRDLIGLRQGAAP